MSKPRKFTPLLQRRICTRLAEGIDISTQCKLFPDEMPKHPSQVYRYASENEEFNEEINKAYSILFMLKQEEESFVGSPEYLQQLLSQFDGNLAAAKSAQQTKLKTIQHQLDKVAPVLSKRWDKAKKVEVSGNNMPTIVINDFFKTEDVTITDKIIDKDIDVRH